jgi:heat shock protein HslJ
MPLRLRRVLSCRERRRGAVTAVTVAPENRIVAAAQEAGLMRRDRVSPRAAALAALLPLFLPVAGCVGDSQPGQAGGGSIVGPVWAAQEIAGTPVTGEAPVTLQLGADGRASGRGGCNGFGGSYTLAGDALSFSPLAATRMACAPALMDQEQRYFDTLAQVTHYAVADDGALLLETGEGKEIRLRKE